MMMTAARPDNADRPVEILAAGPVLPDASVPRLRLVRSRWVANGTYPGRYHKLLGRSAVSPSSSARVFAA
jgi:hypothetical protein